MPRNTCAIPTELHSIFLENVKATRRTLGLTQQDLADRLGVQRTVVTDIERGRYNPQLDLIERLGRAFGIPAHRLLMKRRKRNTAA